MKKLMHCLLMALCLSVSTPISMKAGTTAAVITAEHGNTTAASEKETMARLRAIREIARTQNLSKEEKKALRQEVLSIKEKHTRPGGVVYISTGALILIIILLIILL